jgi:hypothetical protein
MGVAASGGDHLGMQANLHRRWVLVPNEGTGRLAGGGRVRRYSLAPAARRTTWTAPRAPFAASSALRPPPTIRCGR